MLPVEYSDKACVKLLSDDGTEYLIPVKFHTSFMVIRQFILLSPEMTLTDDQLSANYFERASKSILLRLLDSFTVVFGASTDASELEKSAGHDAATALILVLQRMLTDQNATWSIYFDEPPTFQVNYPRIWELLKFAIGRKARERHFEPAYNDLLADHLESQLPKYQTTWARRWIRCCFAIRTAGLVVQCMAVGLRGAVGAVAVPVTLREAVIRWWYRG